ncbi:MAG: molybdate ABC transporter permease subunit [Mariprofundaceae bacterium]|nr:molybdate ABC transporter permease subunit [Mariprofundaceae bacterium]
MIDALWITLQLALITTVILLFIGAPLAYTLTFKTFFGRTVLEVLVALPLVLPPTVLGYYILLIIQPSAMVGSMWQVMFNQSLAFSFSGMVVASVFYSLPFSVQPMQQAFRAIPVVWLELAKVQGLTFKETCLHIIFPASKSGILVAVALVFAHTMGEFGVVLMVGGSIPGETKVASIALFEFVEMQQGDDAWLLALILLGISFVMLSIVYSINKKPLLTGNMDQ